MEILMIKPMKKYLVLAVISFLIVTCTKKATIKLPPNEEKLVVTCFLSPDENYINVVVRLSKPKFGAQQNTSSSTGDVEDATVTVSDGSESVNVPYQQLLNFYSVDAKNNLPVIP